MKKTSHKPSTKTTRSSQPIAPRPIIITICVFFICFFILPMIASIAEAIETEPTPFGYLYAILLSAVLLSMVAIPVGILVGKLRARHKIAQTNRYIKQTNPYQYYKELPNNYGIGIATLLGDSTIENEKDIIAAILDLCAQGYLHLSKHSDHYVIRPLPHPGKTPLSNEAYLLELIRTNHLTSIDYHKWYQLCVNDGVKLGLFHPLKSSTTINLDFPPKKVQSQKAQILIFAFFALTILTAFIGPIFLPAEAFGVVFSVLITVTALTLIGYGIFNTIRNSVILFRASAAENYKSALEKHLRRTSQGDVEFQKLQAFRAFLAQFPTFVDQDPEAVILWDRYLSYAQVFGLASELMTTGYDQLINNAAFKIDNINNVTLQNISLSSSAQPSTTSNKAPSQQ